MFKDKDYNGDLRGQILICSIRAEEAASDALKFLLRTVKIDSKTLSNKSSSLSFKNKVDLLYDIEDITKEDYSYLLKSMEIRNQFIHNSDCNSFIELKTQASDTVSFLKSKLGNEIIDEEASLKESFKQLFIRALGKLLILKYEYRKGYTNEMSRFVDASVINNIESIYDSAVESLKAQQSSGLAPGSLPSYLLIKNSDNDLKNLKSLLLMAITSEKIKLFKSIVDKTITEKDIYGRRYTGTD